MDISYIASGILVGIGALIGGQLIYNQNKSEKDMISSGYTINYSEGVFPFTERKDITFQFSKNDTGLDSSLLMVEYSFYPTQNIVMYDNNGDFVPDIAYQKGTSIYRRHEPSFFKEAIDPIWKEYIKKMDVPDTNKEWIKNYVTKK